MPHIIRTLLEKNIIRSLYKGVYAIEDQILSGDPLHRFEIGMHLAPEGAICCYSALEYHALKDQILSTEYVYAPYQEHKIRSSYRYKIDGYNFVLIQTMIKNMWGIDRYSIGERKVNITDLERTLIDGLSRPQYCGGFREILSAFFIAKERFNLEKMIEYSRHSPLVVQKRLGWVLDQLSIDIKDMKNQIIENFQMKYYDKLDPNSPRRGKYNKKWMLMENF